MRHLFAIITLFASLSASAQSISDQVQAFTKLVPPGVSDVRHKGVTTDGQPCVFILAPIADKVYVAAVAIDQEDKTGDKQVGVVMPLDEIRPLPGGYALIAKKGWNNKSTFNSVEISVDDAGNPVKAVGISDLQGIFCYLKSLQ